MAGIRGETDGSAAATASAGRVLRAVLAVLGRPVLLHAIALSVALCIPAAILFSSNGLRAKDIIALAHHSWLARGLLWGGWLVLSAPALRVLFQAPGTRTLRALRLPRVPLLGSLFLLAATTELPWAMLFARGAGLVPAWGAVTLAAALGASRIAALRRPRWALLGALGAAFVAFDPPSIAAALCGSAFVPCALQAAWRVALEEPNLGLRLLRPGPPFLVIYATHLLRLVRVARSRLLITMACGAGGAAGLAFSLRNDPTERPLQRALTAMALPLTVGAAACVAPVIESEACLRGLLRSLRVSHALVLPAFLLAIATPASALAATAGVVACNVVHGQLSRLVPALLVWGLLLSCAVAAWGRFLEWRGRRTAGAFAAGVTAIAALSMFMAFSW